MKKEKIVEIVISFLIGCIIILVSIIYILNSKQKETEASVNTINTIENEIPLSNETNNAIVDFYNSDYILEDDGENGLAAYDDSQLNNFEIQLINIPKEILQVIEDKDTFYQNIKEYVYINGLVDASEGVYQGYDYNTEDNIVDVIFTLNNNSSTNILISLYLDNNQMEVTEY